MHTNYDNRNFYELSPENSIRNAARCAGLLSNIDIEIVLRYIEVGVGNTIIDLGAGEGRVIAHLLERGYPGHISGVEYANSKVQILRNKFSSFENVTLFEGGVMSLSERHDYGLLSFSFLLEFGKGEQKKLISHLDNITSKGIFIDLPTYKAEKNGFYLPNNYVCIQEEWGETRGYYPTVSDIEKYILKTNFQLQTIHTYSTSNNRKRDLYVLTKESRRPS